MNYYERHLGDYAKDAGHLSMLEHGAYTLLLDRYYTTEQAIPQEHVYRLCRAKTKEERAAVDAVLDEFFTLADGSWINGRADKEITKMQAKVKAAQENGKRGGRPKRTEEEPTGNPLGSVSVTQIKAHQSPDTKHQTPEEKKEPRKRDPLPPPVSCPEGVSETVWVDWLALRRKKSAPVTQTVLQGAQAEAQKAGMTLEAFLRVWCMRGSQGLQADWLKPQERQMFAPTRGQDIEPEWRRLQRERNEAFLGPAAIRRTDPNTIDAEVRGVTPDLLTGS